MTLSQDLIFSPRNLITCSRRLKLKALDKLYYNRIQSQITLYVTTSLKEAESLWRCIIPQLQDISYVLAIQRFISYFIHHITHHHLTPTKHMQINNNLFVNLYVIPYNFSRICSTILARRAKNVTSYIYTTI